MDKKIVGDVLGTVVLIVLAIALLLLPFWAFPTYKVWKRGMDGEAALRQAESEKKILIEQAKAEVEAAELRAEAIRIVGEQAKAYPEYRTQEFIGAFAEAMKEGRIDKIIYVPTEANIPIVEARSE